MKTTLLIIFFSVSAQARAFTCSSLGECAEKLTQLTGKKHLEYVKDDKLDPIKLTGDKKEILNGLSFMLHQAGYTRVKGNGGVHYLVPTRDIRYFPTTIYQQDEINKIPKNYDYHMFVYKVKYPAFSEGVTRSFRPFMSRYGRILSQHLTGALIIQDTGVNIHRLHKLLETVDVMPTKDQLKEIEKNRKFQQKLKLIKAEAAAKI